MGFSLSGVIGKAINNHVMNQVVKTWDRSGVFGAVGHMFNDITGQTDAYNRSVANDWSFWNANNAYNEAYTDRYFNKYGSPAAQMQYFANAGLNPNLIYGSVNGASSLSPASGGASSMSGAGTGALSAALSYARLSSDLRQQDAMTQQYLAQSRLINAQTEALDLENEDNKTNGTSRGTSYPVKIVKQAGNLLGTLLTGNPVIGGLINKAVDSYSNVTKDYGKSDYFIGGDGKKYPNTSSYRIADRIFNFFGQ